VERLADDTKKISAGLDFWIFILMTCAFSSVILIRQVNGRRWFRWQKTKKATDGDGSVIRKATAKLEGKAVWLAESAINKGI
jgi:hypothetical protein